MDFIEQLHSDIAKYKKINTNASLYIKHYDLKKIKFNVANIYLRDKDLPVESVLGTVYLIKGNNIMYFYSYIESGYSPRLEINMNISRWVCKSDVVNMDDDDPENLYDIIRYYGDIRDPEYLGLIILGYLMNKGFDLYIKLI